MCKAGFLPKAYVELGSIYDGVICQIIDCKQPNDELVTFEGIGTATVATPWQ
jgi:hypothetical protein